MYAYALLEAFFFCCLCLAILRWSYRFKSPYNRRPAYQSITFDKAPTEVDYVIIGAGPAGLAAARELLETNPSSSVLILEQGGETLPANSWEGVLPELNHARLFFFSPDLVYSPVTKFPSPFRACTDQRFTARRPFRAFLNLQGGVSVPGVKPEEARQIRSHEVFFNYTPYPQHEGVGGGSLADWGVQFGSAFAADPPATGASPWWRLEGRPSGRPTPLPWAFTDAARALLEEGEGEGEGAADAEASRRVVAAGLRRDADGRRLPLAAWLLGGLDAAALARLAVLPRCRARGFEVAAMVELRRGARVAAVGFEEAAATRGRARRGRVGVRQGVVLAAGVVHSPRLLHRLYRFSGLSHTGAMLLNANGAHTGVGLRDALALPMMFRTYNGVSSDPVNVGGLRASLRWLLTHEGPHLHPLVDVMASIPVPELGPNAELRILLFPFGGRNPELYQRMGWDRMLGSFQEALTLVMVLNGVEGGLHHYLALNSDANNEEEDVIRSFGLRPLGTEVTRHPEANGTPTETSEDGNRARSMSTVNILEEKIIDAFANGMSKCRKIIRTKPLSFLTSGAEAIDFSLLRQDSGKSIQLAKFMHTPSKRLTKKMQADFIKLAEWAGQIITQSSYMKAYVREHAYWLGFGSGTSEPFLNSPDVDESGNVTPNFRVKGFQNIVVGDCSSVSNEVFSSRSCNSNALSAGSVSTAIDAGRLAAQSIAAI